MAIFELSSLQEYEQAVKENSSMSLGKGKEGECFLGPDNYVYKVFNGELDVHLKADNIITSDMIRSTHFIFPNQVYTCNGKVIGTQSDFKPVIDKNPNFRELESNFIKAINSFALELEKLTKQGFIALDFGNNFIFNGYDLFNIDTTNHVFDLEGKYDIDFLMAYNFHGFLDSIERILGEDYTPAIKETCDLLRNTYVNNSFDNLSKTK